MTSARVHSSGPLDVDGLADGWVVRRELAKVGGWSDRTGLRLAPGPHPANAHARPGCAWPWCHRHGHRRWIGAELSQFRTVCLSVRAC